MKKCPVCNKQYDDQQNFCADDGSALQAINANPPSAKPVSAIPAPLAPQSVQIIQVPAKSKTGLYLLVSVLLILGAVLAYFMMQKREAKREEAEMTKMQAADEKAMAQAVADANLDNGMIKAALDSVSNGSSATFRGCAESKMGLYQKRYNKWLEWQGEDTPTKSNSQRNVNLAAQASVNSCRKEIEALDTGVASFDCQKAATPTELTICMSKELAQQDVILANAVKSAQFFAYDSDKFKTFVRTWRKNRDSCGDNIDCISNSYRSTISTLNAQVEP